MVDILIIGAGVIGGVCARELSLLDCSVEILEKMPDVAMGATRANSAIVHAGFDAHEGSLKAKLNVRGSELMENLTRELGVKYQKNGSLVVGFSDEDQKTLEDLKIRGERNGVKGLSVLNREAALALEPNLGDGVSCALHAPSGAIVCPYELCMAAVGNAMDNGAALTLNFDVAKIERTQNGFRVTSKDGRVRESKILINAAGVYSDEIAKLAGDDSFSVHPRRGEYLLLDKECGTLIRHTVFRCPSKMGKGILVSPTVDGNLLLGPTAEDVTDKDDTKTTANGLDLVRRQAAEQVKGIAFNKIITSFTGLRSVGSTGDFVINEKDGFINLAAIESPGLSSSPAIAETVVDMLRQKGMALTPKKDAVRERRPLHAFCDMTAEEKSEVIKNDPTYAHVICRCETVTEGEILAAVRQNPKPHDIDGIKRRTRATMGRCQGGFCTPYLVEILAKELGIDYGDVTKFGGASKLNVGKTKNV